MQIMAAPLGGAVGRAAHASSATPGPRPRALPPLRDIADHASPEGYGLLDVWMSHGDRVNGLPAGLRVTARATTPPSRRWPTSERAFYGLQFHPEVTHTHHGRTDPRRLPLRGLRLRRPLDDGELHRDAIARVRERSVTDRSCCGLSGGVDSSVVAALLRRAIGDQLAASSSTTACCG